MPGSCSLSNTKEQRNWEKSHFWGRLVICENITKIFLKNNVKASNKVSKEESTNWLEEELEFNLQADRPSVSVDVCSDNIN